MEQDTLFPPLPLFMRVPFQEPNWSWWDLFVSLFASNKDRERLKGLLERKYPHKRVVLVDRGTTAIYMALQKIKQNEKLEVIAPSFVCDAVIQAIIKSGCKPIYVDVTDEGNIDFSDLQQKITPKTLAIIPVHQWGKTDSKLDDIIALCKQNKIWLIDDCANTATFGTSCFDFKILSFNMGKGVFGLGGGALLYPTDIFIEEPKRGFGMGAILQRLWKVGIKIKCKKLLTPLFNIFVFFKLAKRENDMAKYSTLSHADIIPKKIHRIQAKIAYRILLELERDVSYLQCLAAIYDDELKNIEKIKLPPNKDNVYTKYTILTDDRYGLSKYLSKKGIETQWTHYPVHLRKGNTIEGNNLKNTELLWKRTLSLPISNHLSFYQIHYVTRMVQRWAAGVK